MIRIIVKGGIGNQMFQYAYGKVMSEKFRQPLLLDTIHFEKNGGFRQYKLGKLGVKNATTSKAPEKFRRSVWKRLLPLNMLLLRLGLPPLCTVYLNGFWQSERYFDGRFDFIRSLFTFPKSSSVLRNDIVRTNSVAVHVRRGDYVELSNFQVCTLDYYLAAMRLARAQIKDPVFYIFSDDIDWCEKNFSDLSGVIIVSDCEDDLEELGLMAQCKHCIISNSSFSWWGAWLKEVPEKIVIAPDRWLNNEVENYNYMVTNEIIPSRWRTISIPR